MLKGEYCRTKSVSEVTAATPIDNIVERTKSLCVCVCVCVCVEEEEER